MVDVVKKKAYFLSFLLVFFIFITSAVTLLTSKKNNVTKQNNITNTATPTLTLQENSPTPTISRQTPTPTKTVVSKKEIVWADTTKDQVVFTFDAGSGTDSLATILSILKKYNIKSTFFLTGKWADTNPQSVRDIASNGHEIFNHTYSHPHLTQISDSLIKEEFTKTENLISNLTGKTTKPYFRPPYGDRNSHVLNVAGEAGYQSVYWTIDAWDWRENEGYTTEQIKTRVTSNLKPGTIYLFHVGSKTTGIILEDMIQYIKDQGYAVVSLTEGL